MLRSDIAKILSNHIRAMGWEIHDCDLHAEKILSLIESEDTKEEATDSKSSEVLGGYVWGAWDSENNSSGAV